MRRHTAEDVAAYIVGVALENDVFISPLSLNRVLYLVYRDWLRRYSYPLFDEEFEAWESGPVVADVFYAYQPYQGSGIQKANTTRRADKPGARAGSDIEAFPAAIEVFVEDEALEWLSVDAGELAEIVTAPGSAWERARNGEGDVRGGANIIPMALVEQDASEL